MSDNSSPAPTALFAARATAATTSGEKYVAQLCKHWSHKLNVEVVEGRGVITFPTAIVTLAADDQALAVELRAQSADELERMKGVVARHLDRFAFREAPLPFEWRPDETGRAE